MKRQTSVAGLVERNAVSTSLAPKVTCTFEMSRTRLVAAGIVALAALAGCTARFAAPTANDNAPDYVYQWLDTGFQYRTMGILEKGDFEKQVVRSRCGETNLTVARDHTIIHTGKLLQSLRELCVAGGGELLLYEPKKTRGEGVRATVSVRPYLPEVDERGFHYSLVCGVKKPDTEADALLRFVAQIDSVSFRYVGGNLFSDHRHDVLVAESPGNVDQATLKRIASAARETRSTQRILQQLGPKCVSTITPRID